MIQFPKKLTKDGFRRSSTLHPVFLSVKNEAIPCSMASMILPEGENLAYRDFVRLYTADGDMGVYMVTAPSNTYPGNPSITLCHAVCLLDDVRIRGSGTLTGSFGEVVQQILQQQSDGTPLFTAGSFADSDISIRVEYNNDTLLSMLKAACTRAYDQKLTIDQNGNPWVLGSVKVPATPTAEGRFTRNLQSVSIDTDGDDQCTRLVVEHTDWSSGEKTYTIHDADSISQYGVIEDVWSVPYGATEEDVNAYVAELLRQRGEPTVSIDIDGYDLHTATGESLDEFATGDLMRCCLPEYNTTVNARITTVEYPDVYGSPDARRVSLRNKTQTLSDLLIEIKKEARRAGGGAGRAASAAAAVHWRLNLTYDELTDLGEYYRALHNEVGIFADATEATLTEYATSIETLYTDTEQLQQTTTSAWERIDGMEGSITLHAERITDLSYEQESIIAEIQVQSGQIALKASKENLDKLSDDFTSLSADVTVAYDNIRLAVHEGDEVLSSLKLTIDGLENWQTDAAGNISELINDVRGLSSVVTAADGRVGRLVNTADGLTSSVGLQGEIMAEFRTRLDEISADVRDANGNFANLAVLSDSVTATVRNAEGKIGALSVTADDIRAAISAQSGAMSSLQVTLEQISSRVQDANGAVGSFTVEAERIAGRLQDANGKLTALQELTEDRFRTVIGNIDEAQGEIRKINGSALWQDRDKIVSAVGEISTLEEDISTITGSTLWQTRNAITGVVGKIEIDANGNVVIKKGSGLRVYENGTSVGVYNENNLTAGLMVQKLNSGSTTAKIKADVINLEGFVKATTLEANYAKTTDLDSVRATITNLTSGLTVASVLSANLVDATQGRFTYLRGDAVNVGENNLICYTLEFAGRSGQYFGTNGALDLSHSHAVTVNNDGTITLGEVSAEGGNFRIADTKAYKDGVSAAKASVKLSAPNGWQNGRYAVIATNGETFTVQLPTFSTSGGTIFDSDHKTKVFFSTPSVSGPLREAVVDASSVYKSGWNECREAMTRINGLYTISQSAPGTLYTLVNGSYTSVGSDWVKVAGYSSAYRKPAEIV